MGLLKKPLNYNRRCDKCVNWIPSTANCHNEGEGYYCGKSNCYSGYSRTNESGYSRLIQRVLNAIMLEFTDGDEMFMDREYASQVLVAMANCCPIFEEIKGD